MLTGGHWPAARRDVPDRRGFCSWDNAASLANRNPPALEVQRGHATRGVALARALLSLVWSRVGVWLFCLVRPVGFPGFSWPGGSHPRRAGSVTPSTQPRHLPWKTGGRLSFFFSFSYSLGGFFRIAHSMVHDPLTARSPGTRVGALDSVPNSLLFNSMPSLTLLHVEIGSLSDIPLACYDYWVCLARGERNGMWDGTGRTGSREKIFPPPLAALRACGVVPMRRDAEDCHVEEPARFFGGVF